MRRVSTMWVVSNPSSNEWSCSRHSPAWSQTGQSRGWLASRNSITAWRASRTRSEVSERTTMPSVAGVAQAMARRGWPSISTRQIRHWPTTER